MLPGTIRHDQNLAAQDPLPGAGAEGRLKPVPGRQRYQLIDILRGFALIGVALSNLLFYSSSIIPPDSSPTAATDHLFQVLIELLVVTKFINLFSFLFGLSFAIQMVRAEARGVSIVPTFLRRLIGLLILGVVHMALLFWGDVLHYYALLGFCLLALRKRSDRALLVMGLVLAIIPISLTAFMPEIRALVVIPTSAGVTAEAIQADIGNQFQLLAQGDYRDLPANNTRFYLSYGFFCNYLDQSLVVLGYFLLGFVVGRRKIIRQASQHVGLLRRIAIWGLVIGLPGNLLYALRDSLTGLGSSTVLLFFWHIGVWIGSLGFTFMYPAAVALLYQSSRWRRWLTPLSALGRTALTNYVLQSVFLIHIFHSFGLGLLGTFGPTLCAPLAIMIIGLQIVLSNWMLNHLRFGPLEWLWRSFTYLRWQPLSRGDSQQ
jgi:uncharacterized protein